MQDRPTAAELLDALAAFMRNRQEHARDRWERFQFQVATNSLNVLKREWEMEDGFMRAEWAGLDGLLSPEPVPETQGDFKARLRARNEQLVERIHAGDFDGDNELPLLRHLYQTIVNKVTIASPNELRGLEPTAGDSR